MNANSKINNLRERTNRLLESTDFCGLAVIMLAITLERQVKNKELTREKYDELIEVSLMKQNFLN